jgi:signal peptidase
LITKIANGAMIIIVICVLAIAGVMILPRLFGFKIYGVLSGSMEPSFKVGSVVFVKVMEPQKAKVGDAITFQLAGNDSVVATHRIIEINEQEMNFNTKGDANEFADGEPVPFERFIGVAQYSLPLLGFMAMFIQSPQGLIACAGVLLFILFLSLLGDVFNTNKTKLKLVKNRENNG